MPLLQTLLGNLFGADTTVKPREGLTVDNNGNLIDENGKIVGPYNSPNLATQIFAPGVAQYEAQQNAEAINAPTMAQQQERIKNLIGINRLNTVKPWIGTQITKDSTIPSDAAALMLGNDVSAQNINSANQAASNSFWNIPGEAAKTTYLGLQEGARNKLSNLIHNIPELKSIADVAGLTHSASSLSADMPNIQPRAQLAGRQIQAGTSVLPYATGAAMTGYQAQGARNERELANRINLDTAASNKSAGDVAQSAIERELAEKDFENIPRIRATRNATLSNALYDAMHPGVPSIFYRSGNTYLRNPASPSMVESMTGKMQPSGSVSTIPVGGGLHLATVSDRNKPLISNVVVPSAKPPYFRTAATQQPITNGVPPSYREYPSEVDYLNQPTTGDITPHIKNLLSNIAEWWRKDRERFEKEQALKRTNPSTKADDKTKKSFREEHPLFNEIFPSLY